MAIFWKPPAHGPTKLSVNLIEGQLTQGEVLGVRVNGWDTSLMLML